MQLQDEDNAFGNTKLPGWYTNSTEPQSHQVRTVICHIKTNKYRNLYTAM